MWIKKNKYLTVLFSWILAQPPLTSINQIPFRAHLIFGNKKITRGQNWDQGGLTNTKIAWSQTKSAFTNRIVYFLPTQKQFLGSNQSAQTVKYPKKVTARNFHLLFRNFFYREGRGIIDTIVWTWVSRALVKKRLITRYLFYFQKVFLFKLHVVKSNESFIWIKHKIRNLLPSLLFSL